MLIALFKTTGHSMQPEIKDKTFFIASSIPLRISKLKKGDKIVFKDKKINLVKKIVKIESKKIYVEGVNNNDSKKIGPIKKSDIKGKVIWVL